MRERLRIIRDKAFLSTRIHGTTMELIDAKVNKDNFDNEHWLDFPKSEKVNLEYDRLSKKIDRAKHNRAKLIRHRDFRLNVLKSIPMIGVATGLLAIGLHFV